LRTMRESRSMSLSKRSLQTRLQQRRTANAFKMALLLGMETNLKGGTATSIVYER